MTKKEAIEESLAKWRSIKERCERGILLSSWVDEKGYNKEPFLSCAICNVYHNCSSCILAVKYINRLGQEADKCEEYDNYVMAVEHYKLEAAVGAAQRLVETLEAALLVIDNG
jgi:hypothetical protein